MSTLRKVGESVEKMGIKALLCGVTAAGVSYFLLKREQAVELIGMEMPEYVTDDVLLTIESVTGNLIGSYVVPYIEQQFVGSENLEKFLKSPP